MKTLAALLAATVLSAGCVVPVDGNYGNPGYGNPGYSTGGYYPNRVDPGYGSYPAAPSYGGYGSYGRIEIGNAPPPVYYSQPVIITQPRYAVQQPPIYVNVPPEHRGDWRQHCSRYSACDRPVYFVRPSESREVGRPGWPQGDPGYGHSHRGDRDNRGGRGEPPRADRGHVDPGYRGGPRAELPYRGRGERIDFGPREGRDGRDGRDGRESRREPDERRRHHEQRVHPGNPSTR